MFGKGTFRQKPFRKKTFKYQVDGSETLHGGSVRWRIFGFFLLFAVIMLVLLWLVQTVFLDSIYRHIKLNDVERLTVSLSDGLDDEGFASEEYDTLLNSAAQRNLMCFLVADLDSFDGTKLDALSADVSPVCIIHRLTAGEILALAEAASVNGGSAVYELDFDKDALEDSKLNEILGPRLGHLLGGRNLPHMDATMLISVSLAESSSGRHYAVLAQGNITPLDATVDTLRMVLVVITGIMVLVALILAVVLSSHISRPIVHISELSRRLAKGDFALDFRVPGAYREINELAADLNHAARELGRIDELQHDLIANISHDLRTPLTLVTGYAEAMRDLPGENTPENVQVIIDEASRLSTLVNDLLDMSKLQAGAVKLSRQDLDLTELVDSIVERFRKLTAADGYVIEFMPASHIWVNADSLRLTQVIYNLVNNAIIHTDIHDGSACSVLVRQVVIKGRVRIEVVDNGEGIAPEQIQYIWQRYYHGSANHQRSQTGSGLGLAIVKSILDLHGGSYGVTSTPGVGSRFWFELATTAQPTGNASGNNTSGNNTSGSGVLSAVSEGSEDTSGNASENDSGESLESCDSVAAVDDGQAENNQ